MMIIISSPTSNCNICNVELMYLHIVIAFCLCAGNTLLWIMLKHSNGSPSVAFSIVLISMSERRALKLTSSSL